MLGFGAPDPARVRLTVLQGGNVGDVALVRLVLRGHRRKLDVTSVEDGSQGAVDAPQLLQQRHQRSSADGLDRLYTASRKGNKIETRGREAFSQRW